MGKSIRLCRLSLLDLGRQGIQVDEQKPCQLMHLSAELFVGLVIPVNSLIAIQAELVSPLLKSWGDPMLCSKFINSLFKLPRFNLRGKAFQSQLHCPAIAGTCWREQTRLAGFCRINKCSRNIIRQVFRDFDCFRFWKNSNTSNQIERICSCQVKLIGHWVIHVGHINDSTNWLRACWASCEHIPASSKPGVLPRSRDRKANLTSIAMRTVVQKDSHEQLQS